MAALGHMLERDRRAHDDRGHKKADEEIFLDSSGNILRQETINGDLLQSITSGYFCSARSMRHDARVLVNHPPLIRRVSDIAISTIHRTNAPYRQYGLRISEGRSTFDYSK